MLRADSRAGPLGDGFAAWKFAVGQREALKPRRRDSRRGEGNVHSSASIAPLRCQLGLAVVAASPALGSSVAELPFLVSLCQTTNIFAHASVKPDQLRVDCLKRPLPGGLDQPDDFAEGGRVTLDRHALQPPACAGRAWAFGFWRRISFQQIAGRGPDLQGAKRGSTRSVRQNKCEVLRSKSRTVFWTHPTYACG
jgi:hypothetical protein